MMIASSSFSSLYDIFAAATNANQPTAKSKDVKIEYSHTPFTDTAEINVTGGKSNIRISEDINGAFIANINDVLYDLGIDNKRTNAIKINTDSFDDTIIFEDGVKVKAYIHSGAGNDYVRTGDRRSRVDAGDGDNEVHLGAEGGTARGGNGNDKLYGGGMWNTLEGGSGNNTLSTSPDARSTTYITSAGATDTVSALAGTVDIKVSGAADIHITGGLEKLSISLDQSSTGSTITLDDPQDLHKLQRNQSNFKILGSVPDKDALRVRQDT